MNTDNKGLAYLQWSSEATTDQVQQFIAGDPKSTYNSLRRLCLQGEITKRQVRQQKTRRRVVSWKLNIGDYHGSYKETA